MFSRRILLNGVKHQEKPPLSEQRPRWDNIIKVDFAETGWKHKKWIYPPKHINRYLVLVDTITVL